MKVLYAAEGALLWDADIDDIYVNDDGYAFLRLPPLRVGSGPAWKPLGKWSLPLTEHEKYYLMQSLGLDPDLAEEL